MTRPWTHFLHAALAAFTLAAGAGLAETPAPKAEAPAPKGAQENPSPLGPDGKVPEKAELLAKLEAAYDFKTGIIPLGKNLAVVNTGDSLRYLGPKDADRLLQAWGNPPRPDTLGMLFPKDKSPFDDGWGVVITYKNDGHVKDDDAASVDYADLLKDMQNDAKSADEARKSQGFPPVRIVGWAEPPHYDRATKKMYWAKELKFGDEAVHTLNYDIRVLGRKGVLELSAISVMPQLGEIRPAMEGVLQQVSFKQGNRYGDFDASVDKVAAYGIGALIAGKLASKAGFFAMIGVFLLKAKKLVVVAVLGIAAGARKLFGRKKD